MAVNTGKNHKINGELKLFAVKDIEELPLEIDAYYNFSLHEMYRVSLGAGFKVEVFTGENAAFTIPLKLEIFPFHQFKNVSFLYEIAPEIYFNKDQVSLRNLFGLRYTFLK
ncbi:MAG: hypothetical protein DSY82_08585 [Flavobacteriia bacterium]|nr:MAG: hypothetical protein DSY82_08585 [Flavobacteriia bacterium]